MNPQPHTDWASTTFRVRYAETDQMGVVYYANYFVWFEIGRTDFCRQHGFAYRDMEKEDGLYIIVGRRAVGSRPRRDTMTKSRCGPLCATCAGEC